MKTSILALVLFAATAMADYVTVVATFTNRTQIGSNFVINGTTVTWTNSPLNSTLWITTNSAAGSATNFARYVGSKYPQFYSSQTNATNVVVAGEGLQLEVSDGYAFLTTNGLPSNTNWHALLIPWDVQPYATNKTNDANELLRGAKLFAEPGPRATFFSNEWYRVPIIDGGSATNVFITNSPSISATAMFTGSLIATNGGYLDGLSLSNVPWAYLRGAYMSNVIGVDVTITNLDAPGTASGSQRLGSGSVASGANSLAVGVSASATGSSGVAIGNSAQAGDSATLALGTGASAPTNAPGGIAIGNGAAALAGSAIALGVGAEAGATNSVAIGRDSTVTRTNQIMLGSSHQVVVPGILKANGDLATMTNYQAGPWSFKFGSYPSLVGGGSNNIVAVATNEVTLVSGNDSTCFINSLSGGGPERRVTLINGSTYSITLAHESGFDTTAGNRLLLPGAANVEIPIYGSAVFQHNETANRWQLLSAAGAPVGAAFVGITNPIVSGQFWTNTTGQRVELKVTLLLVNDAVSGFPSVCMTNISSGESYNATNAFALAGSSSQRVEFHLSPGDYFVATNKSSGSASASVTASWAVRQ